MPSFTLRMSRKKVSKKFCEKVGQFVSWLVGFSLVDKPKSTFYSTGGKK